MADVTFGVAKLFELAFGVKSPVFIPYPLQIKRVDNGAGYTIPDAASSPADVSFSNMQLKADDEIERWSWMGTPIVFPWTLKGGTYKVFDTKADIVQTSMADFEMPAATLVNFSREKIITRTKVRGSKGTVKEMYGFDDWEIQVRGLCLTDKNRRSAKTAQEQKLQLLKWENLCSAISVVGDLFFEKDIMAISIGKINFTQLEGKPDVIPFEFTAYSDDRLELIL